MVNKSNERPLTTGEAALLVSQELGLEPGLSERDVTSMVRSWPVSVTPPVVAGRRRWGREHVAYLRSQAEQRRALGAVG